MVCKWSGSCCPLDSFIFLHSHLRTKGRERNYAALQVAVCSNVASRRFGCYYPPWLHLTVQPDNFASVGWLETKLCVENMVLTFTEGLPTSIYWTLIRHPELCPQRVRPSPCPKQLGAQSQPQGVHAGCLAQVWGGSSRAASGGSVVLQEGKGLGIRDLDPFSVTCSALLDSLPS